MVIDLPSGRVTSVTSKKRASDVTWCGEAEETLLLSQEQASCLSLFFSKKFGRGGRWEVGAGSTIPNDDFPLILGSQREIRQFRIIKLLCHANEPQ